MAQRCSTRYSYLSITRVQTSGTCTGSRTCSSGTCVDDNQFCLEFVEGVEIERVRCSCFCAHLH